MVVLVLCVVATELIARWGLGPILAPGLGEDAHRLEAFREFVRNEGHAWFAPRPYIGYAGHPSTPGDGTGRKVNSRGFRGPEWEVARAPGVLRIACLGGSTTGGSDQKEGYARLYPSLLEKLLAAQLGRPVEVMNFGMPGWTSAETAVNYFLNVVDFDPDVVVVHHAVNDVMPRLWPGFESDYSHFRRPWKEPSYGTLGRFLIGTSALCGAIGLKQNEDFTLNWLVGVPLDPTDMETELAPETALAFRRNVRSVCDAVRARGGVPVIATMPFSKNPDFFRPPRGPLIRIGISEHNELLRDLAREERFLLVDLARAFDRRAPELGPTFVDYVHVKLAGNQAKAELIADALIRGGHLPAD